MIGAPSIHKASHVFVALTVCAAWAAVGCFDTETVDPDVAHESRAIGEPCDWNVQCGSGLCIPSQTPGSDTGWKAGMCTQHCNDGVCDASQVCTMLDDGNYCLPGCSANGQQCRDGYICNALLSACLPDCRNGWDCVDLMCDDATGECLEDTTSIDPTDTTGGGGQGPGPGPG